MALVLRRSEIPVVIAHRGASAYAAEHTAAAYDLALEQGADVLELDVRITADGELVLLHDETLARTAGDPRPVDGLTRDAIALIDPMSRPLTLEAFLARYAGAGPLMVDLKDPEPAWELRVVEAIERAGARERTGMLAFDHAALERVHAAAPWLPLCPLYPRDLPPAGRLDEVTPFAAAIGPWSGHADGALVEAAHTRGLAVYPWTIDDPGEMRRLIALGVDGITTNAPDIALAVVRGQPLPAAA